MDVQLENVDKQFGSVHAVKGLTLHVKDGDMVALLGPSGCGKTTTLFMLAGIYRPTKGTIRFGDKVVNRLRPQERKIGMVFQNYALYPHMSVFDNIAFPLSIQKKRAHEIRQRVHQVAELVQIEHLLKRKPGELSGGQQQRVSLARALVKEPELLLLDEPLSNLDASLRMHMRAEIRNIQQQLGITAIFVTHDQTEAMTMADKIALMKDGALMAYGEPMTLYDRPDRLFVAQFLGSPSINVIPVVIQGGRALNARDRSVVTKLGPSVSVQHQRLVLAVRPEHIALTSPYEGDITGKVVLEEALGHEYLYTVDYGGDRLRVRAARPLRVEVHDLVGLKLDWEKVHWFDEQEERVDVNVIEKSAIGE